MKKILSLIALSFLLQSCVFVAGAAAGAAAIAVVYDHRKVEAVLQDQNITSAIVRKINDDPSLRDRAHISVNTFNHIVLLTGEVSSTELRDQAGAIAQSTDSVNKVYNQLTIQGASSTLSRTNDTWITTKIKTQMLATENLKSSTIKVVTENGVVYLMGIVSREQADIAVTIARRISGVQKVVRIFQFTD